MPRKTESHNPADWLAIVEEDLGMIGLSVERQLFFHACRGKLAEALEKTLKAELIRLGWSLAKIHDLRRLAAELEQMDSDLMEIVDPLSEDLAEAYFAERYPGFDVDDPDWPTLHAQFEAVTALAATIRSRLPSTPP